MDRNRHPGVEADPVVIGAAQRIAKQVITQRRSEMDDGPHHL